ncbi:hypothetical protein QBC34DRAFT_443335 [Podospora aff. communis PSN243]|uniref:C2H2-type domain-containing protein n=1 Tax=Podospora aff. communis PSN243 TaxID=3040156 RepID=A0AAV9G7T6_9PEZI|nr:hypothetical protein QBC34DRAFT_443335 [Podospora aff. communis PSN243]
MDEKIERWQQSVPGDPENGPLCRLGTVAAESFASLLGQSSDNASKSTIQALEQEYAYFRLWDNSYGLTTGDLDRSLAQSQRVRRLTCRHLVSLCRILGKIASISSSLETAAKAAAHRREAVEIARFGINDRESARSDTDSDTEDSGDAWHPVEDLLEDLQTDIKCLVDLGPRHREPVQDAVLAEVSPPPTGTENFDPATYLTHRILHKYPLVGQGLASRLGKSSWDRREVLHGMKNRANETLEEQQPVQELVANPAKTVASSNRDSGLGMSIATPYAETLLSSNAVAGPLVKIPDIPPEGLQGKAFPCDVCGATIRLPLPPPSARAMWRKHIISDLQPFVCIFSECSTTPLPNSGAFANHLSSEHKISDSSGTMTCPVCRESLHVGKTAHLAEHLLDIALCVLPANVEADESDSEHEEDGLHEPDSAPGGAGHPGGEGPAHFDIAPDEALSRVGHGLESLGSQLTNRLDSIQSSDSPGLRANAPTDASHPSQGYNDTLQFPELAPAPGLPFEASFPLTGIETDPSTLAPRWPGDAPTTHAGPRRNQAAFTCSYHPCVKTFPRVCDLRKHERNHSRPIMCPAKPCPYVTSREDNMKRHVEKVHSGRRGYLNWGREEFSSQTPAVPEELEKNLKTQRGALGAVPAATISDDRSKEPTTAGEVRSGGEEPAGRPLDAERKHVRTEELLSKEKSQGSQKGTA